MANVVSSGKALAVNPLKISQPVGASLAFLGLASSMPLEHGARGCTSFNKLFFMRHFREPIALQTTAMEQVVTVLGADDNVVEALRTIAAKNAPDVVGLITTGLAETQGADIASTVKMFRKRYPEHGRMAIVPVNASDALGCLETGFALALEAIIAALVSAGRTGRTVPGQVNVLVSSMLTPGDIDVLRDWLGVFGLTPIIVPDVGDSLDGHLIDAGYSTLTYGGTPVSAFGRLGQSVATLVIGPSIGRAADLLRSRTGVPDYRFDGLLGVEACDRFTQALSEISGRAVPDSINRQRDQLLDAMVDCQFQIGGSCIALAAEADLLGMLGTFVMGLGARVVTAVTPIKAASLKGLPLPGIVVGDMEDLETGARRDRADLLIANSHGTDIAARLRTPLLHAGYPQYDLYGGYARAWIGYRASRQLVFDLANLLARHYEEIAPYRSRYWQGTPREREYVAHGTSPSAVRESDGTQTVRGETSPVHFERP